MSFKYFIYILAILFYTEASFASQQVSKEDFIRIKLSKRSTIDCLKTSPAIAGSARTKRKKIIFTSLEESQRRTIARLRRRPTQKNLKKIQEILARISELNAFCERTINPTPAPPPADSNPPQINPDPDNGLPLSLEPYSGKFTEQEAQHLFRRIGFGASRAQLSAAVKDGLPLTVDKQINPVQTPNLDQQSLDLQDGDLEKTEDQNYISSEGVRYVQLLYSIESPNALLEKMTYFFEDLFAASYRTLDGSSGHFVMDYYKTMKRNSLGNFRVLAKEISINGMMLHWLDGRTNKVGNVNENYAREFWELFTLGKGNYTEKDINEAARALTGWTTRWSSETDEREVVFRPQRFDNGTKVIFENTPYQRVGNFDLNQLIDVTLDAHPKSREHLAKALFFFLVGREASQEIVNELSSDLLQSNFELKPIIKKIILSNAFFSSQSRRSLVKTPLEFALGFLKSFSLPYKIDELDNLISDMGQQILNPPSVKGWDDNEYWLNHQWIGKRMSMSTNIFNAVIYRQDSFQLEAFINPEHRNNQGVLTTFINLIDVNFKERDMQNTFQYFSKYRNWDETDDPFDFQRAEQSQREQKLRGLLVVLTNHYSYMMN